MIAEFQGEYRWLSNFWECPVFIDGLLYKSSEAAFQAYKTIYLPDRQRFTQMAAGESKRAGRTVDLREDWEEVKVAIMYRILMCKFTQNLELLDKLLDTNNEFLIEGNNWRDKFWGVCNDEGQNWLGRLLMAVRDRLRDCRTLAVIDTSFYQNM